MQKLIITAALLIFSSVAVAQTGGKGTGSSSTTTTTPTIGNPPRAIPEAPIGHRQPRADQVPPETDWSNPNTPVSREDAALDRKIKSICRGC
jgi:hypothetical protein